MTIHIGIIGDYDPTLRTHKATDSVFSHAPIETHWLPTPSLLESAAMERLAEYDDLFAAAATPYKSMQAR